jgi:hypothetical protein
MDRLTFMCRSGGPLEAPWSQIEIVGVWDHITLEGAEGGGGGPGGGEEFDTADDAHVADETSSLDVQIGERRVAGGRGWLIRHAVNWAPLCLAILCVTTLVYLRSNQFGHDRLQRADVRHDHLGATYNASLQKAWVDMAEISSHVSSLNRDCVATAVYYAAGDSDQAHQRQLAKSVVSGAQQGRKGTLCGFVFSGASLPAGCDGRHACPAAVVHRPSVRKWKKAIQAADVALAETPTSAEESTSYQPVFVLSHHPEGLQKVAIIGDHVLYRVHDTRANQEVLVGLPQNLKPGALGLIFRSNATFAATTDEPVGVVSSMRPAAN